MYDTNIFVNLVAKNIVTKNIARMKETGKKNPFKFGTVVEKPYFTDREEEIKRIRSILKGENHLILISPRRYGKTSLIMEVVRDLRRPVIDVDLQMVTSAEDLAAQLLKRIYRIYPLEKIKELIRHFRILPAVTMNPLTGEVDVTFRSTESRPVALEDVLSLLNRLTSPRKKLIVIFDEFQNIRKIGKELDHHLRGWLQHHQQINYVFLGSQESLIRAIFEKKSSPFYHFGFLLPLGKIPRPAFRSYLEERFGTITERPADIAEKILEITGSHPYYTQQLAFTVWEILMREEHPDDPVEEAVEELIRYHDIDYERLWNTLNRTDMKILIGMTFSSSSPLSEDFSRRYDPGPVSTVYSSLKRMMQEGFVVKTEEGYGIDDPFFRRWIWRQRTR